MIKLVCTVISQCNLAIVVVTIKLNNLYSHLPIGDSGSVERDMDLDGVESNPTSVEEDPVGVREGPVSVGVRF